LRKSLRIDPRLSLEIVRANEAAYAGRAIEVTGVITGSLRGRAGHTVVMSVDNSVITFVVPPALRDADLLSSGASVRMLMLVGQAGANSQNASSALSLTPLAVTLAPRPVMQTVSSATMGDASPTSSGSIAIDQLPAATEIPLLQSKNATTAPRIMRGSISRDKVDAGAPTIRASAPSVDNPGSSLEDQVPAYRAMIKRLNPKVRDDVADQIARAMLQAGTGMGMDPRFLASIIAVESNFDVYSRSSSGAMGLGQIMPFNFKEAGITNAWDPVQNVWGTARILRGHLLAYKGRPNRYASGGGRLQRRAGCRASCRLQSSRR
jgi:soluble lytic murein transglycosylase-like protein